MTADQLALTGEITTRGRPAPQLPAPHEPEPQRPTEVWRISGHPVTVHDPEEDRERGLP